MSSIDAGLVLPDFLDTAAIMTGALTGAMHARRKGLDFPGVFLVAVSTGVGGGLIRDVLLQQGIPALFLNPAYQLYALIGSIVGVFFASVAARLNTAYDALDTFMIGAWVLLGCTKAQAAGLPSISVAFIGTIAAIGGGLLRDVLCNDPPQIMLPGHFYAVSAFSAAITYVVLVSSSVPISACQIAAMAAAIITRVVSLHFDIVTPGPYDLSENVLQFLHLSRRTHANAIDD